MHNIKKLTSETIIISKEELIDMLPFVDGDDYKFIGWIDEVQ